MVSKASKAPMLTLEMPYDVAASLCHLINTQNGFAQRLAKEGKPILLEHCMTTKPLWEALISYLDKNS